jgi:hypothetical protein
LLAAGRDDDDIPLIQTIGLLSDEFAPLAAKALERRSGAAAALIWLADRVTGWSRVYVVEALCRRAFTTQARDWLLRRACDGDYLNGYYLIQVATAAHLQAAITASEVDDAVIDHTGLLLTTIMSSGGMSLTLDHYPPACIIFEAHAQHVGRQPPTVARLVTTMWLIEHLAGPATDRLPWAAGQRQSILERYAAVRDRADWREVARRAEAADDEQFARLTKAMRRMLLGTAGSAL